MGEVVRYNYRLRPGANAEHALESEWHRCRFLWNEAVFQWNSGKSPTLGRLSKLLTEARARNQWLREGSQVAQQQVLRTFGQALESSFKVKNRGRPAYKGRKTALPSLGYTTRGFSIQDGQLVLPKGVKIPVVWSRDLPSEPTSVRVFRDSLGHWYASFVVRREVEPARDATVGVGIDWGVSTTATATDPAYDQPHLGHRKRCAAELAKAQRKMARRRKTKGFVPSKGYKRAKCEFAKLQKAAARRNQHESRMWARRVVDNHELIAVEDFHPKFLAKSTMARKSADAAIGAAKRILVEYGVRAGRRVVLVQPAYTTMTCAGCFARAKQRLALDERIFRCHACGLTSNRDRNAAGVILAVAERGHTRVDDVRHWYPSFESDAGAV
ncbi:RNA-guided endonuclease InsQ/TnpB family protein [Rhodococcus opacus]|uniref:RNA-guided endonuclease InsQ/TnpB family protein n=1 Tax=Rhodococcus opacus TaxID=37919 RepID=UPI0024BB0EB5|nr:transposase [Rhodococcus opacus]MDJ0416551.1 transposase [Rhodococcus opacus]